VEGEWDEFQGANRAYVLDLYERYIQDPTSVDPEVRRAFQAWSPPASWYQEEEPAPSAARAEGEGPVWAERAVRAAQLIEAIRTRGHRSVRLDPLAEITPDPPPSPEEFGLTEADLARLSAASVGVDMEGSALDAVRHLTAVYAQGSLAYEFGHLDDPQVRRWLETTVERGEHLVPLTDEEKVELLSRLTQVEALEQFLHQAFPGQKRFSIEGLDMLVPMLEELISLGVRDGMRRVVLGMAHRGRLNVLAHILGKPYEEIVAEFQDHDEASALARAQSGRTGDVKYHLGRRRTLYSDRLEEVELILANNPSHLEFVNPVVKGLARAGQDRRDAPGEPAWEPDRAMDVTVHGDAAFPGEGVVAETLNLSRLKGYDTGGTIHILANNRIGFTTDPEDAHSTRYPSDPVKGYDIPVVHVCADDPEACLAAVRLAYAYRRAFHRDFMVDLVGYRRWGHNEGDEPSFTQPVLYERVRSHPTVRTLWAQKLGAQGLLSPEQAEKMRQEAWNRLREAQAAAALPAPAPATALPEEPPSTAVDREVLERLNEEMLTWPSHLHVHPRLARTLGRRRAAFEKGEGVDWAHAEALAFATLLEEGVPVRLAGQDTQRGTFSQRHLVLHDVEDGHVYVPLAHLSRARASFAVYNSPLSETAAMGFEYGYSVGAPEALVLWEAQFGDFANVAQVIIDQFLAAARAKWGERSGLVLLLPHGYEGMGPEHSSARLERFLQLAAEDNFTVANLTSAAQYFHLLRRQARLLAVDPRPLVLLTPKSLLRHPLAQSSVEDLVHGSFEPVRDDGQAQPEKVEHLLLASGHVVVEYLAAREKAQPPGRERVALLRLEQLYPFPAQELRRALERYPHLREVVWMQEEPRNMGAWAYVQPYLSALVPAGVQVRYVGPPAHAAPAPGWEGLHQAEMRQLLEEALRLGSPEGATAGSQGAARKRER
jgi:2-oxoglutarate dehydrogenase E1 component